MILKNINQAKIGTVQYVLDADDLRMFADEIIAKLHEQAYTPVTKSEDELYTREKVMEYLHIKSTTLWHWAKMGILTPIKIKRKCFYRKSDVLSLQSGNSQSDNNND